MSKLSHVVGDLLASDEHVIGHGCNTVSAMGAGIALHIARAYPEVERVYSAHCRTRDFRVGTCQAVTTNHDTQDGAGPIRIVLNLGTQRNPGRDATYFNVMLAMGNAFEWCIAHGHKRMAIPRIGCGIAGLEWDKVEWVINGIFDWIPQAPEVVVYTLPTETSKWTK